MRVVLVEAVLEGPTDHPGLGDPAKELAVQALIPEPGVEALGDVRRHPKLTPFGHEN